MKVLATPPAPSLVGLCSHEMASSTEEISSLCQFLGCPDSVLRAGSSNHTQQGNRASPASSKAGTTDGSGLGPEELCLGALVQLPATIWSFLFLILSSHFGIVFKVGASCTISSLQPEPSDCGPGCKHGSALTSQAARAGLHHPALLCSIFLPSGPQGIQAGLKVTI